MTYHQITRTARTAPRQEIVIDQVRDLLTSRITEVPEDGYDRVDYRLEIVLDSMYDATAIVDMGSEDLPVRDLLTDLVHLCEARGWDIADIVVEAQAAARRDAEDWGER